MKQEFDQYCDGYRLNCDKFLWLSGESSTYFAEYKAKKLAEWFPFPISPPAKILDFGCGDGLMTHFIKTHFPNSDVFGVDPSPKSIEKAKAHFNDIHFSTNSDEHTSLEFSNNYFDIIYAAGVMHHIPFNKHSNYLNELMRILKSEGSLVIFELNPLNPLTVITFKQNPIDRNATLMPPWYTQKLVKKYGPSTLKFCCFFPKILSWLRFSEAYLTKIPLGALYALITQKQRF